VVRKDYESADVVGDGCRCAYTSAKFSIFFVLGGFVRVAALGVFGLEAKSVWGQQWIKMLALLYEGVTVGLGGGILIGG